MSIRNKLIVRFVSVVALILISSSAAIYFFSADYREDDFYRRLENKGRITAKLLIEVDEVNEETLKRIESDNPINLSNERLIIYDYHDKILYSSDDEQTIQIAKDLLDRIRLDEYVKFRQGEYEALGFLFKEKYDRFVVIVAATDIYGLNKLKNLRTILYIVVGIGIFFILIAGYFYVGNALKPIANVIREVDDISATSLHRRLDEGNGSDEFSRLSRTFNSMLVRLESAFSSQKTFIANASHELRNPLTAILGQIDVALLNSRNADEYEAVLRSLKEDITNLKMVSNRLLLLAQANMDDHGRSFTIQRCDEILWDAQAELLRLHPEYSIEVQLDPKIDDESKLGVLADEQLLKGAFVNIIDNGCKYSSDHHVVVRVLYGMERLVMEFVDKGIGINDEDLPRIFDPFFRGRNAVKSKGHGIGLSLVSSIIKSHFGQIGIVSSPGIGTTVTISLPIAVPG